MHWADKIAEDVIASGKYTPYWVDDMKTPSGFAHIGSMLGPMIHSAIYRALKDSGKEATLTYVFNDFDPADEFPNILKKTLEGHQGEALKMVPSPDSKFDNLADFLADDLQKSLEYLGFEAEYVSSWELYHQGRFDEVIRLALDNSEKIQDIYQKVSGSAKKESGWLPFQVICEKCGKLGTTKVFAWDGKEVSYKCEPDLVSWAKGCGHEGKVSPFGGAGKLPWKVDWAAHWAVLGVTIEGAGKDHASAGGSYDIAMAICKEVFKYPEPYKLPYEFILIGGKKMSSSKGVGLKAHDLVNILPPEVARFLFIGHDIKSQSNFDPTGTMAIPDLFDKYDEAWAEFNSGLNNEKTRAFELSQINQTPDKKPGLFVPRFRDIANFIQLTTLETMDEIEKIKGNGKKVKLTWDELKILEERKKFAHIWIGNFAPEEYKMQMLEKLPSDLGKLSNEQKLYLGRVADLIKNNETVDELQLALYNLAKELRIQTKDAFAAIYQSFIGKDHGPRAAWFLLQYPKNEVIKRLKDVLNYRSNKVGKVSKHMYSEFTDKNVFSISNSMADKYPSATVGIAIIRGITVKNVDPDLEKHKDELIRQLSNLTNIEIEQSAEIQSYHRMYKEMHVDWAKKKSSPAALLRRVAQGRGLYTINTCVDAYNLVVMKYKISAGAFDLDQIKFPTVLDVAKGRESALFIGDNGPTTIKSGEVCYFDKVGPYNLDYNYRDSVRTSVTEKTKNIIINTEGIYDISREQVERTLQEVIENIIRFCGGKLETAGIVTAR